MTFVKSQLANDDLTFHGANWMKFMMKMNMKKTMDFFVTDHFDWSKESSKIQMQNLQ